MTSTEKSERLNYKEAASLLGVTLRTLERYKKSGLIKFIKCGGRVYFNSRDVEQFMNGEK